MAALFLQLRSPLGQAFARDGFRRNQSRQSAVSSCGEETGFYFFRSEVEHVVRQPGEYTDPEAAVHDPIGHSQFADDSVVAPNHVGLAYEVASENRTGTDLALLKLRLVQMMIVV